MINKVDLPSAQPEVVTQGDRGCHRPGCFRCARVISAKTGLNVQDVLEAIVQQIPAPEGDEEAPLQALIFDAFYDNYKGRHLLRPGDAGKAENRACASV